MIMILGGVDRTKKLNDDLSASASVESLAPDKYNTER